MIDTAAIIASGPSSVFHEGCNFSLSFRSAMGNGSLKGISFWIYARLTHHG
jgi:hypothetical protein